MLNHEEQTVLDLLKGSPETYFARREVARRAVKRTLFEENPHWADAPLASLIGHGLVDVNENGQVKFKKENI
jgi:hypothetical protein